MLEAENPNEPYQREQLIRAGWVNRMSQSKKERKGKENEKERRREGTTK